MSVASNKVTWPVARVRQEFVDFFVNKKAHSFVPSAPVIPHSDPTLLFINAGMNQFKGLFLGTVDPNTDFGKLRRATNSQLCIRAGGKHNDLDDVGRDTYHHTFFEMLGSWSFGDYFKKDAIAWAWELLTKVYGLPEERLYVTYFEGNPASDLPADEESRELWRQFVPEERIIKGNAKDNFWEMGDTGPCGPCTEIHFDRLGGRDAASLVNNDDPMVIEIWNIVFIQFDRQPDGTLKPLPQPHVDTGMGLERITSILQDVHSNYGTDAWLPIFDAIQRVTKFPTPYDGTKPNSDDVTVAYRVVADHIRCLTVALADGAMPDSVGRGFVLRRIIRRAIRYGVQFLGAETGFFNQLVDAVVASLGDFFKHLQDPKTIARVKSILLDEEESFAKTWKVGLKHFEAARESAVKRAKEKKSGMDTTSAAPVVSGVDAFILHDRYGFPVDLTALLAEKDGMTVDIAGFNEEMKKNQTSGGRVAAAKTFIDTHQIDELRTKGVANTNDASKYTWEKINGKVLAIFHKAKSTFIDVCDITDEDAVGIITDTTNFYAEAGGQIYDTGYLTCTADKMRFAVHKVFSYGGYIVHIGNLNPGSSPIKVGEEVVMCVDYERRHPIAANHTATHQLNQCLRRVLQDEKKDAFMEVNQKGSLVTEEMLRFDFSYNTKLSNEELERIEQLLNKAIGDNLAVYSRELPLEEARAINGLRQMFGEKYPDPVSVVSIGVPIDDLLAQKDNAEWRNYSIEFCGGTHIKKLGEIQRAVIISEDALMKGVRRIVIYTREAAENAIAQGTAMQTEYDKLVADTTLSVDEKNKALSQLNKLVGDSSMPLVHKNTLRTTIDSTVKQLIAQGKAQAAELKTKAQAAGAEAATAIPEGEKFIVKSLTEYGAEREPLQAYADGVMSAREVGVFLLGIDTAKDKALIISAMPKAFVDKKVSAVDWIKAACGKGGGKPNAAQFGVSAKDAEATINKATAAIPTLAGKL